MLQIATRRMTQSPIRRRDSTVYFVFGAPRGRLACNTARLLQFVSSIIVARLWCLDAVTLTFVFDDQASG